jgi:hypothetical protein
MSSAAPEKEFLPVLSAEPNRIPDLDAAVNPENWQELARQVAACKACSLCDHQEVQAGHRQDRQVLVEVLHGDRVAGTHQDVAAVLQQGIHRHDEEAREGADQDQQQGTRQPDVWTKIMTWTISPSRCRAG